MHFGIFRRPRNASGAMESFVEVMAWRSVVVIVLYKSHELSLTPYGLATAIFSIMQERRAATNSQITLNECTIVTLPSFVSCISRRPEHLVENRVVVF